MALIGYARLWTDDQNVALPLDALRLRGRSRRQGVWRWPGGRGLADALKGCAAGDVLVVARAQVWRV